MVHRRTRSAPFRSCIGNANVNCGSRLGLSLIAGGSSQIKLKVKRKNTLTRVRCYLDRLEGVKVTESGSYQTNRAVRYHLVTLTRMNWHQERTTSLFLGAART